METFLEMIYSGDNSII